MVDGDNPHGLPQREARIQIPARIQIAKMHRPTWAVSLTDNSATAVPPPTCGMESTTQR